MRYTTKNIYLDVFSWIYLLIIVRITTTLPSLFIFPDVFVCGHIIMPVITRSMAKGGLPVAASDAPSPSHRPTCSNAIYDSLVIGTTMNNNILLDNIPDLLNPFTKSLSSSKRNDNSESTMDTNFEISNFGILKSDHRIRLIIRRYVR